MNALKLCLSGTALSMLVSCATWDWESAAAYASSPQYQAYQAQQQQQYYLDQQLAQQQYANNSYRLIQQSTANAYALQAIAAEGQRDAWLARRLNAIENSINRQSRSGYQWYR